ncbi:MAG: hypothetical protein M3P93_16235, partial [Actinomycetota bacterium]|nr:hypothetical protein [Actinomycetota bacterium]
MTSDTRPTAAEQARTSMDTARAACLTTWPRTAPSRPHLTTVRVVCDADGRPVVSLAPTALAAAHLQVRPLATVH